MAGSTGGRRGGVQAQEGASCKDNLSDQKVVPAAVTKQRRFGPITSAWVLQKLCCLQPEVLAKMQAPPVLDSQE